MGRTLTASNGTDESINMLTRSRFTPSPLAFAVAIAALVGGIAAIGQCSIQ